ncbi:oxidoreductase, FAD/FMN-binding family protein [Tritrichomonas foetus]|uniref:Oxidoreductase, FAD/FMN-binding family protein n=1 Tax=Tritrichomonas foetus TaxID=1144522 RepID=A0A1J4K495_9EUKA|nr:oxidoreductase, FAD/FMN-binding family protein [Tritrichomonas foetus]|eukprot:OHT04510.1 oxidoreductase, FAD/FMN-binding family protein [Tritrichomonas foetus]
MSDSIVYTPKKVGRLTVPNRFMRSATWEALADKEGRPTDALIDMLEKLAIGQVGLIVPGAVYVNPKGQNLPGMSGLSNAEHARIWHRSVANMHKHGSKVVFQLIHGGTDVKPELNGFQPVGPTAFNKNQHELTNAEIEEIINDFVNSAKLAHATEADGVQLHCAHGYLLSEFLSPALNRRTDKWGGSPENRCRIVKEIIDATKANVPGDFSISIKMNGNDYIDGGVTPDLAAQYVKLLVNDIDFFEISGGVNASRIIRSKLNEKILTKDVKKEKREELIKSAKESLQGVKFTEMYNLDSLKVIRKAVPNANLALVGGISTLVSMEKVLSDGSVDLISLSRPFLNDPYLALRFKVKTIDKVNCVSCGACILNTEDGVYCHLKGK